MNWKDKDICVDGYKLPIPDGNTTVYDCFGSSHPSGFNALLCDGSVRFIPYTVEKIVIMSLSHKSDGNNFKMP